MSIINLSGESRSKKAIQFVSGIFIVFITVFVYQILVEIFTLLTFNQSSSELNTNPFFEFLNARLTVSTLIVATWFICRLEKTVFPLNLFSLKDFVFACTIASIVVGLPELLYSTFLASKGDYQINYNYNFLSIPFRIIVILLAVIGEELIYRYFLIDKLKAISKNKLFLIIASSIIFAGTHTHLDFVQMVPLFFRGILYGYAFVVLNSISIAIALHFIHNVFAVLIFGYDSNSVIIDSSNFNENIILFLLLLQSLVLFIVLKNMEKITNYFNTLKPIKTNSKILN